MKSAQTVEEEIRKEAARIARLKAERDKGFATKASALMRQAIGFIEQMEPHPTLTEAVEHVATGASLLSEWEPEVRT